MYSFTNQNARRDAPDSREDKEMVYLARYLKRMVSTPNHHG